MSIFANMLSHSAIQQAAESSAAATNAEFMARDLKWQVNKLTLINMALFELLHEKLGLTDAELQLKMAEIDLRDGRSDGRVAAPAAPVVCEDCGKTYSRRNNHCLYCGHINRSGSPF